MSTLPDTIIITAGNETAQYVKQAVEVKEAPAALQNMTFYSQQDPRWASFEYDKGYTIGKSGCLITCIAMIGSMYYDGTCDPLEVAQRLKSKRAFSTGLLTKPEAISRCWEHLTYAGATNWHYVPADLRELKRELELFDATIIQVLAHPGRDLRIVDNSHFVVLRKLMEHDALIVDPWDGQTKALLQSSYTLPGWSLQRAIYGMRRFRVIRDD